MSKTKEVPKATRGQRNCNPGNIRYNKFNRWLGLIGKDNKGFCRFSSVEYGFRALVVLLKRYLYYGYDTPKKIISRFAPVTENNTVSYIRFVCDRCCISEDTKIYDSSSSFYDLISAIAMYESNIDITGLMIKEIYDSF